MLAREDRRELAGAGVEQLAELEHHLLPFRDRRVAPAGERPCRGLHGEVDVLGRGEAHALLLDAERGVVDGSAAVGRSGDGCPVDPVLDGRRLGGLRAGFRSVSGS